MNTKFQIILIILFSIFFRLFFLDLIEFKYDEGLSVFQTYSFFQTFSLPQSGMVASTGIYNFPLFNYLLIILGLLSQNPIYLSFLISLINILAIILFYFLTRKIFGSTAAFISSISLAISPWAIIFSRKIWAQDLILVFVIPLFYYLQKIISTKKSLNIIKFAFLFFILVQLHASGMFLALAILLIFLIFRIKINLKNLIIGFLIAFIFAVPYLFFELSSRPFCIDCHAFLAYQRIGRNFDMGNFIRPLQIMNGLYFEYLLGKNYQQFVNFNSLLFLTKYIFMAEFSVLLVGIIYFLKYKRDLIYLPLLILIISSLYFITRTPSFMHYYVIILPLLFLFYGLTFYYLFIFKKNKIYQGIIVTIFLIFFVTKFFFNFQFFNFLSTKQNVEGDYGPVFKLTENRINENLSPYFLLPDKNEMTKFAYIFINTSIFHQKMGDYFLSKNYLQQSLNEYQKALTDNPKDEYSKKMIEKISTFLLKQKPG